MDLPLSALINGNLVGCEGVKLSKGKKGCYRLCLWKHQLEAMIKFD